MSLNNFETENMKGRQFMNDTSPAAFNDNHGSIDTHKRNVMIFFSDTASYWESVYERSLENRCRADELVMHKRKSTVLKVVDEFAASRSLSVLDIGCGPGVFLEEMVKRGHRVSAIDISERMVKEANEKIEKYGFEEPVCVQGDVEDLHFPDESQDLVLCLGVLPYLLDDSRALDEIGRVLKKGGMTVFVLTNLLKLGNFFDPYYYCCRYWQYLWFHVLNRRRAMKRLLDSENFGANKVFVIRRYTLMQIHRMFKKTYFQKSMIYGNEYGPLTFWRRNYLPDKMSERISSGLERLEKKQGLHWLQFISSEWVIACIKK
ncbi:MAG: hypothetical protein A2X46_11695 [Lentisphaerae bacterium GWF2_57_35]|nr:MAG: hypothetical protein A2X46_11695 [Lentisphaerae bacterium GWF2_57_35]